MSEKRFVPNEEESYESCWDNQEQDVLWLSEMIDLLNNLYDENKQLKERNAHNFVRKIQLMKENEELRQTIKEMKSDEKLYANEIVKLNKEAKEVLNFKELGGDY